jgi:3-oxoacyl-[acyl-carrier-protein] synthase-3|tara:strand:+ start:29780 stop:30784 length:1005 start_codon:yes stop_codon:yes gene_type:complete
LSINRLNRNAKISGVAGWLPDYVLTNEELSRMVETSDDWITTRTGIKERRILKDPSKATSDMGANALNKLLNKCNVGADEIDLIICATVTPDMLFPSTACLIADKVGAKNAFGFDLSAACSAFIFALDCASKYISSGQYNKVVVIGADKMSSIVDYNDRQTCVIFGDGAAAVLLEPDDECATGVIDSILKIDGAGGDYLKMIAGGSLNPASLDSVKMGHHFIYQDGKTVFKFAVTKMADVAEQIMKKNNLSGEDVDWLVPHQANLRIIDATANRMNIDSEKVMVNIHKYGNTTAATIPLCLADWEDKLNKGDNLILAAFGGGFTWGAVYLKWSY